LPEQKPLTPEPAPEPQTTPQTETPPEVKLPEPSPRGGSPEPGIPSVPEAKLEIPTPDPPTAPQPKTHLEANIPELPPQDKIPEPKIQPDPKPEPQPETPVQPAAGIENKPGSELNPRQKELLEKLKTLKKITRKDYAQMFNISVPTAARDLKELTDKKLLQPKGPLGPGRWYEIPS
ncbi:MAG: DeoR family transcriptional regulator, partial [Candidatus Omnitrophota bacterium]